MKSHDRTPLGAIDDTPPMRVADASVRAATHVATLPRDEVAASTDRHARGLRALAEITGATGESVVDGLRDIAPDLADWIVDFSYGDVMSRPGLDRRSRQLATVAALTALGHCAAQLEVHIRGALNVGCTRQEIVEVILQMTVYAGFPAAINALAVAHEAMAPGADSRG
jgi:4-carboxymuconolactone decarboxylase